MPRYFTHLYSNEVLRDEHGQHFASLPEALAAARATAGELIAEDIAGGQVVDLGSRLEVVDEGNRVVINLIFADLFEGPGAASPGARA